MSGGFQLAMPSPDDWRGLTIMADTLVKSGLYKTRGADPRAEIAVKILMGAEFGLNPIQSLNDIHVVEGKPSPSAFLLGRLVDAHPDYRYEVLDEREAVDLKTGERRLVPVDRSTECRIRFWAREGGEWLDRGVQVWTVDMAKQAGLAAKNNWKGYVQDMLFNRCLASGVRQRIPGVVSMRTYVAEETEDFTEEVDAELIDAPAPPPSDAVADAGTISEEEATW